MAGRMTVKMQFFSSFLLLIVFTVFVGLTGGKGIRDINEQNQVQSHISSALVNIQDAQASSLRFVIYGTDNYLDDLEGHGSKAVENIKAAMAMTDSEEILQESGKMIEAVTLYVDYNNKFREMEHEKKLLSASRAESAANFIRNQ